MKSATDEFSVQAYQTGEQINVIADLPGVQVNELTVGFTSNPTTLIIEAEGIYRAQVPLPWESIHHSKAHLNNGIFDIEISRSEMEAKQNEVISLQNYRGQR
jgi:HSP20 family molecular chaperone IbpA